MKRKPTARLRRSTVLLTLVAAGLVSNLPWFWQRLEQHLMLVAMAQTAETPQVISNMVQLEYQISNGIPILVIRQVPPTNSNLRTITDLKIAK